MTDYYIYRYLNNNHKDIKYLGKFSTSFNMLKLYDVLTNIFGEGFFYRRQQIDEVL